MWELIVSDSFLESIFSSTPSPQSGCQKHSACADRSWLHNRRLQLMAAERCARAYVVCCENSPVSPLGTPPPHWAALTRRHVIRLHAPRHCVCVCVCTLPPASWCGEHTCCLVCALLHHHCWTVMRSEPTARANTSYRRFQLHANWVNQGTHYSN